MTESEVGNKGVDHRLSAIRIVLVEPAGPLNVGSVARAMANMGLARLVLVNPQCDPLGDEARQMAVHAGALLETAQVVSTLPEALEGCRRAIATTARHRAQGPSLELPEAALPWLLDAAPNSTALIFGPEDRGLSNEELNFAQRWVGIPSNPAYPSLNLAQAVAVCCYELGRAVVPRESQSGAELRSQFPAPLTPGPVATLDQLEGFYNQLATVLLQIGYVYPHTCESRMEKFRHFFNRAAPTEQELAMLRGILRQMDWALGRANDLQPPQPSSNESP
ncbi:RNA methyltransferase [Leptolyngbya sp. PCC 6406]|uniref:RNA methyltransferase n=1 Tax=Leptolyngbya sp. PCC 6406 TaxID=1173264 RepID=UPI000480423C|nr:RNA methyltransferase [Leptolyngbya sp. PCC 6406]